MEHRLAELARAANIEYGQIQNLAQVSGINLETLSNMKEEHFIQVCQQHCDQTPKPAVVPRATPGGSDIQTQLAEGLTALRSGLEHFAENFKVKELKEIQRVDQ